MAALREQIEKYLHLCFGVTPYEPYMAVAEKLNSLAPGKFAKKTIYREFRRGSGGKLHQDRARVYQAAVR